LEGWRRLGFGGLAGLLEPFEFVERIFVGALGLLNPALEAGHGGMAEGKGLTGGCRFARAKDGVHFVLQNFGIDAGETAQAPVIADERVDIEALFGTGRLEAREVLSLELLKSFDVFAVDTFRLGVDAGFQSIAG
jgi:hypothetical protein